jgi:Ser/Thr protein kinase RdoA (MazF antagonist)
MAESFQSSSYLVQVRRLRALAFTALKQFPLRVEGLHFINHGENATFKVTGKQDAASKTRARSENFLLRIHRAGYHSRDAIFEELEWLKSLASSQVVQAPIRSRTRSLIEGVSSPELDTERDCDVLQWIDGRFARKGVGPSHMFKIGEKLSELQIQSEGTPVKHRRYWTAEGLMGTHAKLGSIYNLRGVTKKEQGFLSGAARELLTELRAYSKSYPRRQGLIHADLHFGNAIFQPDGSVVPIDFDDCGYGFHMYDLCIPLTNIQNRIKDKKRLGLLRSSLIEGYSSRKSFDAKDEEMLHLFSVCRRLAMVGWLHSRADNPKLRKYLQGSIDDAAKAIKTLK